MGAGTWRRGCGNGADAAGWYENVAVRARERGGAGAACWYEGGRRFVRALRVACAEEEGGSGCAYAQAATRS